ncbi:MAG: hypothetical protein IT211_11550 [Armatimonadetes bacterium]|nr:hypothetical protein [Armatimonadota bacterium]
MSKQKTNRQQKEKTMEHAERQVRFRDEDWCSGIAKLLRFAENGKKKMGFEWSLV